MSQPSIVVRDLTVRIDTKTILDGLTFDIKPGRLVGLIGPSGSGKTTLMRTIVGIQIPTSGQATIFDRPAGSGELRGSTGYLSQSAAIYNDLTVEQNLRYFATLYSVSADRVKTTLRDVDLTKQTSQLVSTLSGGQKARVSLAIALLHSPKLLVLDEPTVGLDPVLRQDLWKLFRSFADAGKTIIVSSHVMDEAERCDDLLLLRDGKLLWNGENKRLLSETVTRNVEDAFLKLVREGKDS